MVPSITLLIMVMMVPHNCQEKKHLNLVLTHTFFLNKSYIYLNSTPDERGKEKPENFEDKIET